MIETLGSLQRKIRSARELKEVVRTMKTLAAVNIRPYEQAARALEAYDRAVELGLLACLRETKASVVEPAGPRAAAKPAGVIIFGSDQGLVGQFNEHIAATFLSEATRQPGEFIVWPVGERVEDQLVDSGLQLQPSYRVPDSVAGITPLISQILSDMEPLHTRGELSQIVLHHNRPKPGALYEGVRRRVMPLDREWLAGLKAKAWPTRAIPDVLPSSAQALSALIREYLFVCLFQACAESLAAENASRLAAMQRAEKNIQEMLEQVQLRYQRQRQDSIDEELFDVVAGYEALTNETVSQARSSAGVRSQSCHSARDAPGREQFSNR